jgi:hypothetical protein
MKNMNHFGKRLAVGKLFRSLFAVTLVAILSACGGGGGSAGGSGTVSPGTSGSTEVGKVEITMFDQNGVVSNRISDSGGLIAKAYVTDSSGKSVGKDVLVSFTLDSAYAVLSPNTALTNADGIATVSLKVGTGAGAGKLTATATLVGVGSTTNTVVGTKTFDVNPPVNAIPTSIAFISAIPSDASIVKKGSGGSGRSEVAILTFSVKDSSGAGIPNIKVNFSLVVNAPVTLGASTGITDTSGNITTTVNSGTESTSVSVIATVDSKKEISTRSDTITVTTGDIAPSNMTVSLDKLWVEGINIADQKIVVGVFLSDAQQQAVADNTQVVFTTDAGAVLGINGAQCQTNKANITSAQPYPGYCSIYWRSQKPFLNGVATLIASATSGSKPASSGAFIYMLGSEAKIYKVDAGVLEGRAVTGADPEYDKATNAPFIMMDFTASCAPQDLNFEIVDVNNNPMPPKSVIAVTAAPGTVTYGAVYPAAVPKYSISPGDANFGVVHRGTIHSVRITPSAGCNSASSNVAIYNSFDIKVTTPGEISKTTTVGVKFKQ